MTLAVVTIDAHADTEKPHVWLQPISDDKYVVTEGENIEFSVYGTSTTTVTINVQDPHGILPESERGHKIFTSGNDGVMIHTIPTENNAIDHSHRTVTLSIVDKSHYTVHEPLREQVYDVLDNDRRGWIAYAQVNNTDPVRIQQKNGVYTIIVKEGTDRVVKFHLQPATPFTTPFNGVSFEVPYQNDYKLECIHRSEFNGLDTPSKAMLYNLDGTMRHLGGVGHYYVEDGKYKILLTGQSPTKAVPHTHVEENRSHCNIDRDSSTHSVVFGYGQDWQHVSFAAAWDDADNKHHTVMVPISGVPGSLRIIIIDDDAEAPDITTGWGGVDKNAIDRGYVIGPPPNSPPGVDTVNPSKSPSETDRTKHTPSKVTGLSVDDVDIESVSLVWDRRDNVFIYVNDMESVLHSATTFELRNGKHVSPHTIQNLEPDTDYTIKVEPAVDGAAAGFNGQHVHITTEPPLIVNPSFEEPVVTGQTHSFHTESETGWDLGDNTVCREHYYIGGICYQYNTPRLPIYKTYGTEDRPGMSGAEQGKTIAGTERWKASDGNQYVMLNKDVHTIKQTLNTEPDTTYVISFDYKGPIKPKASGAVIKWNDVVPHDGTVGRNTNHNNFKLNTWESHSVCVTTVNPGSDVLSIQSIGVGTGRTILIDNIEVKKETDSQYQCPSQSPPPVPESEPTSQLSTISNLTAIDITNTTITVSWNGQAGVEAYNIQWTDPQNNRATTVIPVSTLLTTQYQITNLTPDTDYTIRIAPIVAGIVHEQYSSANLTISTLPNPQTQEVPVQEPELAQSQVPSYTYTCQPIKTGNNHSLTDTPLTISEYNNIRTITVQENGKYVCLKLDNPGGSGHQIWRSDVFTIGGEEAVRVEWTEDDKVSFIYARFLDDDVYTGDRETPAVQIAGGDKQWKVIITDDDSPPVPQQQQQQDPTPVPVQPPTPTPVITISGGSGITEGGTASFTISSSPAPTTPITVNVQVSQTGSFGATGASTVTISSATTTYTISTTDDNTDEPNGTVSATIQSGTGYTIGTSNTATVQVFDNDDPVPVPVSSYTYTCQPIKTGNNPSLTDTPLTISEYNNIRTITVPENGKYVCLKLDNPGGSGHQIWRSDVFTIGGEEAVRVEWTEDDKVSFIYARFLDDDVYTGDRETPAVQIAGGDKQWKVIISDDDSPPVPQQQQQQQQQNPPPPPPPPTPEITISGGSGITEGGTASFTISSNPAPATPITVNVQVSQTGSFGATGAATVTVNSATTTYTIQTTNDNTDEPNGTVSASIQSGTGYTVGAASLVSVTVSDDDSPPPPTPTPVITISGGNSITEGGTASFTISSSPAPTTPITVNVQVSQTGSFGATGASTVTVSGTTTTYTVTTTNDDTDEADGAVTATIQSGTGYTIGTSNTATVQVSDDDNTPDTTIPVITVVPVSVTINAGATYTDTGITCNDDTDGDISNSIVKSGTGFNTNTAGTHTITYNCQDAAGNNAIQKTRTVTVISQQQPVQEQPTFTRITGLTADAIGVESITISWDTQAGVDTYEIRYWEDAYPHIKMIALVDHPASSYILDYLWPDTAHTIRVTPIIDGTPNNQYASVDLSVRTLPE